MIADYMLLLVIPIPLVSSATGQQPWFKRAKYAPIYNLYILQLVIILGSTTI